MLPTRNPESYASADLCFMLCTLMQTLQTGRVPESSQESLARAFGWFPQVWTTQLCNSHTDLAVFKQWLNANEGWLRYQHGYCTMKINLMGRIV